jgi:hypothetical protein
LTFSATKDDNQTVCTMLGNSDAVKTTMTFDPRAYAAARVAATRPRLSYSPERDFEEWQSELRDELRDSIGLPEHDRVPMNARITETLALDGYRRERIEFTTRPGLTAMGYFLIPDDCPPVHPTVLCLPGHGRGVDSIIGIAEDGSQRPLDSPDEYAADFALQCVANGYPAFAVEVLSFGHRRDAEARNAGPSASSCNRDSMAALMLGETMIGWRVWDAIRAIDYLTTRPEVDAQRIATMGISGGGLISLFTAALDMRVHTAVVSGYLNTFADSILSIGHCVDNYAPGLQTLCEMPDIACLITPRRLYAESGRFDRIFPVAAFEKAAAQVSQCYTAAEVPTHFAHDIFDGDHRFHGVGAFSFLRQHL